LTCQLFFSTVFRKEEIHYGNRHSVTAEEVAGSGKGKEAFGIELHHAWKGSERQNDQDGAGMVVPHGGVQIG
jgi:hypothetical protein